MFLTEICSFVTEIFAALTPDLAKFITDFISNTIHTLRNTVARGFEANLSRVCFFQVHWTAPVKNGGKHKCLRESRSNIESSKETYEGVVARKECRKSCKLCKGLHTLAEIPSQRPPSTSERASGPSYDPSRLSQGF